MEESPCTLLMFQLLQPAPITEMLLMITEITINWQIKIIVNNWMIRKIKNNLNALKSL